MTVRNLKVYGKDRIALLLSFLTQMIIFGLFLLFIKLSIVNEITDSLGELKDALGKADIEAIVNSWLVAGIAGTSVVTASLNALTVMVHDKMDRIEYDCKATSVRGRTVVFSYFSGATLSAFITSALLLTIGLAYIAVTGGFFFSAADIAALYATVMLGSVSGAMVLMLFVSFFKKDSTLSAFNILISVAIGFAVGAYMPISQFNENVQTVVNLIPGSQITSLLRSTLMQPAIDNADKLLNGADGHAFAQHMRDLFSIKPYIFGNNVGTGFMLLYSFGVIALFTALNILFYRLSSKRKE